MDIDRAAALIKRAKRPRYWDLKNSTASIDARTGASEGLLSCAECAANVILEIPVIAAAPANPDRLPVASYRCTGCAGTRAPATVVIGQVQDVVERRWADPVWLAKWCSREIRRAEDAIAEDRSLFAWLASAPRKNMRALIRALRDTFIRGLRRNEIRESLQTINRQLSELEDRQVALEGLRAAPSTATPLPSGIVWEVAVLAEKWADSPSAQMEKRWALVRSTLGDDRLRLTADRRILLVTD